MAYNGNSSSQPVRHSRLLPADASEVQDLVCVGFGPASLAVAIALNDALEAGTLAKAPRVIFLEKQKAFAWHAGMLLPGAKMQISFLKDLASLRDPRSAFTFINFLHSNGRLIDFTNLNTFLPARAEFEDYLRWCASFFDESVQYGTEVVSVTGDKNEAGQVARFRIVARSAAGEQVYQARNVLVATGGQASLPPNLPASSPRVVHSSQYAQVVPKILSDTQAPYRVAVIGGGQSAAEIFNNVQTLYPNAKTYLVMRQEFLKPSDDSPFVNSIFNPSFVDELYERPIESRDHLLTDARATNYGVVRLGLIETLYDRMYHQRRLLGDDETKWPHRILANRRIVRAEAGKNDSLRLVLEADLPENRGLSNGNGNSHPQETFDVDLIVAATGYKRQAHIAMLEDLWPLLPETRPETGADGWKVQAGDKSRALQVSRDYRVQFNAGALASGSNVYLQGCNEGTHGLSDTLLSVLATRSGEIVESIFGQQ